MVGIRECLVRTTTQPPPIGWGRGCWQKGLHHQLESVCKPHAFVFFSSWWCRPFCQHPFPQQMAEGCVVVLTKHSLISIFPFLLAWRLSSFHFRNFAQRTRASPEAYRATDAGRWHHRHTSQELECLPNSPSIPRPPLRCQHTLACILVRSEIRTSATLGVSSLI